MKSMRFVIQRVTEATCEVDQEITGQITNGFCVLIGIAETDTKNIADKMIRKLLGMRIFGDENGKTNLSLHDIEGSLLLISQFTLYADCRKGNRPSFIKAGNPELANALYGQRKISSVLHHRRGNKHGPDTRLYSYGLCCRTKRENLSGRYSTRWWK
jgi:D-tyrosyl-tRNA(Tyr) deacylase